MHTGMLWFDKSDKPLFLKIEDAYQHYVKKHGRKPTLVFVHPSALKGATGISLEVNGAQIRAYRPVLPGHIWIGIEDAGDAAALLFHGEYARLNFPKKEG